MIATRTFLLLMVVFSYLCDYVRFNQYLHFGCTRLPLQYVRLRQQGTRHFSSFVFRSQSEKRRTIKKGNTILPFVLSLPALRCPLSLSKGRLKTPMVKAITQLG